MDLPKFTCDLYMADRIEEVAKNRVCVCMHVGALAMILEIFEFPYRVLLGHDVFDLQFEFVKRHRLNQDFTIYPGEALDKRILLTLKCSFADV